MQRKKRMDKKAQLTGFIIIGMLLLIGAGMFFYITQVATKTTSEQELSKILPSQLDKMSMDTLITTCIQKVSAPLLARIAENGGTLNLNPNDYRLYNATRYRYLCTQRPGYTKCVNMLLTRESMQDELQRSIKTDVMKCVGPAIDFYRKRGYDVVSQDVTTKVTISTEDVTVFVNYPITATLGEAKIVVSDYSQRFNFPLGKFYDLAMKILDDELGKGYFDQEAWMYNHSDEFFIRKHRPYPDMIYKLNNYDTAKKVWYTFNFALQGYDALPELAGLAAMGSSGGVSSPLVVRSSAYDSDLGCCHNKDNVCFENGDRSGCSSNNLDFKGGKCAASGFECNAISTRFYDNRTGLCNGRPCMDCINKTYKDGDDPLNPASYTGPAKRNGESWCVYEGPAGHGFDYVGSRHYKQICIDGQVYVEECRDYRDELCTETIVSEGDKQLSKAMCRPNRWQDCHTITTEAECKDTTVRDCYWNTMQDTFVIGSPAAQPPTSTTYEKRHCVPQVPPGLRFWNSFESMQVCGWANNYYECKQPGCFQEWSDFDSAYCLMQGDCGLYRNYLGKLPTFSLSGQTTPSGGTPSAGTEQILNMGNPVSAALYDSILPNDKQMYALNRYKRFMSELPIKPLQREQPQVTAQLFVHNKPNDYSMTGILTFIQNYVRWGQSQMGDVKDIIWDMIWNNNQPDWYTFSISTCNAWSASLSATDCSRCNNNQYRPCSEYKCKSLGQYCNYEELNGIGKCSAFTTSTTLPETKFVKIVTPGYTVKDATIGSGDNIYIGKEIKEELKQDLTFEIETTKETQCKMTILPAMSFGFAPEFPGTSYETEFSKNHSITIPLMTSDALSVLTMPLELTTMINVDPDYYYLVYTNLMNNIKNTVSDIKDKCEGYEKWGLMDCDDIRSSQDQLNNAAASITSEWNKENGIRDQLQQLLGIAQKVAITEILTYVSQNKYHMFVSCVDRSGNENKKNLDFIRFRVSPHPLPRQQTEIDTPPSVIGTAPFNDTSFESKAVHDNKIMITLFIDQLAECSYASSDMGFASMADRFGCDRSSYSGIGLGYQCNTSIPVAQLTDESSPLYIRCMDHPEHYETYAIKLKQGSEFSTSASGIRWIDASGGGPSIVITNPTKLNDTTTPEVTVPDPKINFFLELGDQILDYEKAVECRYSATQAGLEGAYATLVDPASNSPECKNCTTSLDVSSAQATYYFSCHFQAASRNEGGSYQYTLKTPASSAATTPPASP